VVYGFVVDSTSAERLAATSLVLLDSAGKPVGIAFADTSGAFVIRAPRASLYRVQARRLGYQERVTDPIDLRSEPSFSLLLRLYAAPIPLPAVTVEAVRLEARLQEEGFYVRKRMGFGHFVTPEMIAQSNPVWVTDLMRGMSGVRLVYQNGVAVDVVLRAGDKLFAGRSCRPTVLVDGVVRSRGPGGTLEDIISVDDIAAAEVYPGAVGMPVQAGGIEGSCGALVFWTRRAPLPVKP
jgi:hypothetical protein